jgi:YggT family protein
MIISQIIRYLFELVSIVVVVDVILSFFMSPFHPVRMFLDRIVNPLLSPIRKIVPPLFNMDFSPVIFLILWQLLESLLLRLVQGG